PVDVALGKGNLAQCRVCRLRLAVAFERAQLRRYAFPGIGLHSHIAESRAVAGSASPMGTLGRRHGGFLWRPLQSELVDLIRPDEVAILIQPGFQLDKFGAVMRSEITLLEHITEEGFVCEL